MDGSIFRGISSASASCAIWRKSLEKHFPTYRQDPWPIGEESSERYNSTPAQLTVIEGIC